MNEFVLDLDVGNSSTKWRIGEQGGTIVTGELPSLKGELARVRVAAVATSETALRQQIVGTYGVQPEFAKTTKTLAGVLNGYDDFAQLGVDRWLALVAAWRRTQCDLLVFDLGTAMTVDYVQADGIHLGGYIVPGPTSMRSVLGRSTRDVQVQESKSTVPQVLLPARNTDDAVNFGLAHLQLGWVKSCTEIASQIFCSEPKLILTGKDLTLTNLCEQLTFQFYPDLVLEGLAIALP